MKSLRRIAALLLTVMIILPAYDAMGVDNLAFGSLPDIIRPGKLIMLNFTAPMDGDVSILLVQGDKTADLYTNFPAKEGQNSITWDGMVQGEAASPGPAELRLMEGDQIAKAGIMIGDKSPVLSDIMPSDTHIVPGLPWSMSMQANMQGTLQMRLQEQDALLYEGAASEGEVSIPWDGTVNGQALTPGEYSLVLQLKDDSGFLSNAQVISVTVDEQAAPDPTEQQNTVSNPVITGNKAVAPVDYSPYPSNGELNYWTLPMDITDEAAIWQVMTQPITVLDGDQKAGYKLRAKPEDDADPVGEITYESQGVRVLETLDNGWSLIESYSSCFHDSTVKVWGDMVQGYVKTSLLKTKKPSQKYGLLIDKLTQRMYVFKDGKLFTQLLVSTGLVSDPEKKYTETQAGDYLLISKVGKFYSDNLQCDMAIRFNNGNLIHQVPYTLNADGSKFFDKTEPKLGTKASHGCVRIQRRKNPQGVNMAWLWNNLDMNTTVLIWEDYKGRQMPIPGDDTKLYYNSAGGSFYHSDPNCPDVRAKFLPLSEFTYGQLDTGDFANLTRCPACAPPMRKSEIEAINQAHAN